MHHLLRPVLALGLALALAAPLAAAEDCDSGFLAPLGSEAYQFSPAHEGALGNVRLFSMLSYQGAAATREDGTAYWKLVIVDERGHEVLQVPGVAPLHDESGQVLVEHHWDGRDKTGAVVAPGRYRFTFLARFLPDRLLGERAHGSGYDGLAGDPNAVEARASWDEVIVDPKLTVEQATSIRGSLRAATCQIQQHAPIETGFGYDFYYGTNHSHSNWSDGGQPTTACSSGNAYGSGTNTPANVFADARSNGLDFLVVNEHNHLIPDAIATNDAPLTPAKVLQRYQDGLAAANTATQDGAFVGLYGMEWGVISNGGHVTLIETPKLFGWEPCSGCSGASPECTVGSTCYFDVYTPKLGNYLTLYQRSVENPSAVGPLGSFCHPSSSDYDSFAFNANADAAIQGVAVRSGLAFSTTGTCSDTNVASSDYSGQWRSALNKGFHAGPVADHDAHCNNVGTGIPTRTVYLLPNGTSPALTKTAWMQAHKARHFFATEDSNVQLVFATGDGAHIMGDVFTASGSSVTLRAAHYDPNGDAVSRTELWRGQVGGGTLSAAYQTFTSQASFSVVESPAPGTYYYFVHVVQADGHDVWSAPMWITFPSCTNTTDVTPPVVTTVSPTGGTISCTDTLVRVTATDATGISSTQVQIDGGPFQPATLNAASGQYEITWASSTATSASHTINSRATDSSCQQNVGTAAPVTVTVDNSGCPCTDATAPVVAITAPTGGTLSCSATVVQASASDAAGIASVDIRIDGGDWLPAAFNSAASRWEITWPSNTASNAGHTLQARATDLSCASNVGTSAVVNVTVDNSFCDTAIDISDWKVVQANSTQTFVLPDGTLLLKDGYVIVARGNTGGAPMPRSQFETFWNVTLGSNVTYVDSGGLIPLINGDETFTLKNASDVVVDGPTIAMSASASQSIRRNDPCLPAGTAGSWTVTSTPNTTATPGTGAAAGNGCGVVINEFSDATGTGNFIYEFLELHYDAPAAATPSVSVAGTTVTEGNSGTANATFLVTLSASSAQAVTVQYATTNGTASAPGDYTSTSGTLTFAAGVTSANVLVPVVGETLFEGNETFTVTLSNPSNATLGTATATGTINNDDTAPSLAIGNASATEGNTGTANAAFTVTLSAASGLAATVQYATSNGTAVAPGDYSSTTGTLTFAAGTTSQTVNVPVVGDTLDEVDETFTVTLSNAANASIGTAAGTGTITDDDPAVSVSIAGGSLNEGNSGSTNLPFTVSLSTASGQQVTVQYATSNGTATAGSDYTAASGTLTFAAGNTSQTVNVAVLGDTVSEPDEAFTVTLSNPAAATLGSATATGTITNDDASVPTITAGASTAALGQSVNATVANGPAGATDWIALAATSAGNSVYVDWKYLNGQQAPPGSGLASATVPFTMPSTAGSYEFRFFASNGFTRLATSSAISVGPTISAGAASATTGQAVNAIVANGTGSATDWIGLAATTAGNTEYLDWKYLNGLTMPPGSGLTSATVSFNMPSTAGNYEFRLFASNSFTRLATSGSIAVAASTTPVLQALPSPLAFGSVTSGSSKDLTVTVKNVGGGTLSGSGTVSGTGFSLVGDGSYALGANATKDITVRFSPGALTSFSGSLTLSGGGGATVGLSGTGVSGPSITPASTSVSGGQVLNVTVSNGPAGATDWIALAVSGAANTAYVDWKYLNGLASPPGTGLANATVSFTMPTAGGSYEFRFFASNGFTRLATSSTVTLTGPTIAAGSTSVGTGQSVNATVANGPANTTDWIALALASAPDTQYVAWAYLNGSSTPPGSGLSNATVTFTMPGTGGSYQFRLFASNGFTRLASSQTITVTAPAPTITPSTSSATAGGTVSAIVANAPGVSTDWIALSVAGSANTAYVDWRYLNGTQTPPGSGLTSATVPFTMPASGSYEFRLFSNNGFTRLATSGTVTVTP